MQFSYALFVSFLGTVFATTLLAALNALEVEGAADDVVADTWEVGDTTTAYEHYSVLLEVVAFAADVGPDFLAVGEADAGDFAEGGVGFFWCFGGDFDTNATF